MRPSSERHHLWSFVGHADTPHRRQMLTVAKKLKGGLTYIVGQGNAPLSSDEYRQLLLNSQVTLVPASSTHPETSRLAEALEAGSIPIIVRDSYYQGLWGNHPLPTVDAQWEELPALLSSLDLSYKQRQCVRWWRAQKHTLRAQMLNLIDDKRSGPS
mmetsp:Transcript_4980/g.10986  ORF Transcript_4980/g.10986 Transcript_4980/m.10986 type:complete len:157 (-) Transcript_4980:48-518(-)